MIWIKNNGQRTGTLIRYRSPAAKTTPKTALKDKPVTQGASNAINDHIYPQTNSWS